jgi:chloramphenicol 3-O phosphotransferase
VCVLDKGKIIILNGASSSGKTSIANHLKELLKEPTVYVSIDDFIGMFQEKYVRFFSDRRGEVENALIAEASTSIGDKIVSLMHSSVAGFSLVGYTVIVDHVITSEIHLMEVIKELKDYPVIFIGVQCPLDELERREKARGDRAVGLARDQYETVHKGKVYDFEIDTFNNRPIECAQMIKDFMEKCRVPMAFNQMRNE